MNEQTSFTDEVRTEIGDQKIVGLGLWRGLNGSNFGRACDAMQHGGSIQLLSHTPTGTRNPEWVALGRENIFCIERNLNDLAWRSYRAADQRLVREFARVNILREDKIARF